MSSTAARSIAFSGLAIALAAVGGCVGPPAPAPMPPRPAPAIALPPPPPRPVPQAADWRDWPVTPGNWFYRVDARGTIALFGVPGADALVTLRCDAAATMLYMSRRGATTAPLTVRTSNLTRALPVQPTLTQPPYVAAALTPRDPLLDAMAFSRGRFILEQPGTTPMVIPAWAEVARVIEDCRR